MIIPLFKGERAFHVNYLYNNLYLAVDKYDTFMDFFNSIQYGRHPYTMGVIYPPLINLIYGAIGKVIFPNIKIAGISTARKTVIGLAVYGLSLLAQLCVWAYAIWTVDGFSNKKKIFIGIALLFTFPFVFCFERGNIIFVTVALILVFINKYSSTDKINQLIAFLSLAIAAGIKIYPALFGILLIRDRKWSEAIKAIIIGVIVFFIPFIFFDKDNRSLMLLISNILNTNTLMQSLGFGLKLNISNVISVLSLYVNHDFQSLSKILRVAIVFFNIGLVVFDRKMEEWKVSALLSLLIILLPDFSYTYTLLYLFIPIVLFLQKDEYSNFDVWFSIILILPISIVPISNQFEAFSEVNIDVSYRFGWTCFMENISLILLEICIITERFLFYKKERSILRP